jgi:uncharacterized membrane protein YdjX (TVP38/TMEM64 family)
MRWAILWVLLIGILLLPFLLFEEQFNAFALEVTKSGTSRWVAGGSIFALLALDVFLPVPSSIVSTAAGILLGLWKGAAIVWAGMTIGSMFAYALGTRGAPVAKRLVGEDGLTNAERLFRQYGDIAIVVCRPIPVLAEASVVFAGLTRASYSRFLLLNALSNLGIAFGYAAFGAYSLRLDSFLVAFIGALLVPGLLLAGARLFKRL